MPTKTRSRRQAARIIIADDHELARGGLRSMLAGERELELVGEASNGREALELCRELQPDLALLDVRMPEMDGLAATRAIRRHCPDTSTIIVTMYEAPEYLIDALKAGAAGYVLKDATRAELIAAIRQVLRGESIFNGNLATRTLQRLAGDTPAQPAAAPERLTSREREVLGVLAQGHTNREIAGILTVSAGTVKIHVEHIIAKLGASDRTHAAVRAAELGLLKVAQ
jgi:DNA-binding NarL/FixJ family response regulator